MGNQKRKKGNVMKNKNKNFPRKNQPLGAVCCKTRLYSGSSTVAVKSFSLATCSMVKFWREFYVLELTGHRANGDGSKLQLFSNHVAQIANMKRRISNVEVSQLRLSTTIFQGGGGGVASSRFIITILHLRF